MIESRNFFKPIIKTGKGNQYHILVPYEIVQLLKLQDREEVEVIISKSGRGLVPRKRAGPVKPFGHLKLDQPPKASNFDELTPKSNLVNQSKPSAAEIEFLDKYLDSYDQALLVKAYKQFGTERTVFILKEYGKVEV